MASMKRSHKRKANQPQKKRHEERILSAATETFLQMGYEETSTADIARGARVSKRELYSNFADKRDILAAVITQLQDDMQSQADIGWNSTSGLRTVLIEVGTHLFEFVNSERFAKVLRIVVAESFRDPASAERFYHLGPRRGRERTAAFMRRQMKAGHLRKANPLQAADDFLDLVVSSRRLTAVVLGQRLEGRNARTHVRHAVEMFLMSYGTGRH
jgi:TetR/AcrR family transcriptional repressor of mexJK operon